MHDRWQRRREDGRGALTGAVEPGRYTARRRVGGAKRESVPCDRDLRAGNRRHGDVFRDLASPRAANPMVAAGIWWNRNAAKALSFSIQPERHIDAVRPPSFWQLACLGADLDPGWLAMVGSGGKRVYVLPSRELVIARLDRTAGWNDGAFLRSISA